MHDRLQAWIKCQWLNDDTDGRLSDLLELAFLPIGIVLPGGSEHLGSCQLGFHAYHPTPLRTNTLREGSSR